MAAINDAEVAADRAADEADLAPWMRRSEKQLFRRSGKDLVTVERKVLTERLKFLQQEYCNPADDLLRDVGGADINLVNAHRQAASNATKARRVEIPAEGVEIFDDDEIVIDLRSKAGQFVEHWITQFIVITTVIVDVAVTIYFVFAGNKQEEDWLPFNIIVVVILGVENLCRMFWLRGAFWRNCINVIEFLTVVLSIVMISVEGAAVVGFLRVIRPIARGFRVIRLASAMYKQHQQMMKNLAKRRAQRHQLSNSGASQSSQQLNADVNKVQRFALRFVDHIAVQVVTWVAIFVDVTIAIIMLTDVDEEESTADALGVVSIVAVSWLLFEILVRLVGKGHKFFLEIMNVIELVVVIAALWIDEVTILRAMRPAFRGMRLLRVLIVIYNKRGNATNSMRHAVRMNKRGYVDGQYDLDLCYVTDQIIAMSVPALGKESLYRNPIERVAKFFNEQHTNSYLILNFCSEKDYPVEQFFGRCLRFAFDDHSVPTLEMMFEFATLVHCFLSQQPANVAAIHCKGGKGRTGTMCCAYLLHAGLAKTAAQALGHFECRRTDEHIADTPKQGVETASQVRFVHYFAQCVRQGGFPKPAATVRLVGVRVTGMRYRKERSVYVKAYAWGLDRVKRSWQQGPRGLPHVDMSSGKRVKVKRNKIDHHINNVTNKVTNTVVGVLEMGAGGWPSQQSAGEGSGLHREGTMVEVADEEEDVEVVSSTLGGGDTDDDGSRLDLEDLPFQTARTRRQLVKEALNDEQDGGAGCATSLECLLDTREAAQAESQAQDTAGLIENSMPLAATDFAWDIHENEMKGEVKFEFHCRDKISKKKKGFNLMRVHKKKPKTDKDGNFELMLFSLWIHTSFLQESGTCVVSDVPGRTDVKLHTLSFTRYELDKGTGAPKLKSYGPATEVELDFLVPVTQSPAPAPEAPAVSATPDVQPDADAKPVTSVSDLYWSQWAVDSGVSPAPVVDQV